MAQRALALIALGPERGDVLEAELAANEALAILEAYEGIEEFEPLVRLAGVRAARAAKDDSLAKERVTAALERLADLSSRIEDSAVRERFLSGVFENRALAEEAKILGVDPPARVSDRRAAIVTAMPTVSLETTTSTGVKIASRDFDPRLDAAAYEHELELRFRVLREPIGMTRAQVKFAGELEWTHFAAWRLDVAADDPRAMVGCVILSFERPGLGQLRQMAVDPGARLGGVGRVLVDALEAFARKRDVRTITMHAREVAAGFYEKLGYATVGERFEEVGLPHWVMEKALRPSG